MREFEVIRSGRRTICIQIDPMGKVIVRAPLTASRKSIEKLVESKSGWIERKVKEVTLSPKEELITPSEREMLRKEAWERIPQRVKFWADSFGFEYASVRITSAEKRYGSCSAKGNLCFSLYLARYSDEILDYVIVHELCHTKEHNHSRNFYRLVESILPDYKKREEVLKRNPIPRIKKD